MRAKKKRSCLSGSPRRKGAALVEFAFVAPLFFLLVFTLIEFAGLMMGKNVLTAAARDGARSGALPGTVSLSTIETAVQNRLQRGGIAPSAVSVTVTPSAIAELESGQKISVSLTCPMTELSWIFPITPSNTHMSTQASYYRE